ncbi:MAG: hypothetical protein RL222_459, partial [Bacteroidota bacterium]
LFMVDVLVIVGFLDQQTSDRNIKNMINLGV